MTKPTRKDREVYEREREILWGRVHHNPDEPMIEEPITAPGRVKLGWWMLPGYILHATIWAAIGVIAYKLIQ